MYSAGINITANRLFGPQPRTATYVCLWEIHLGPIKSALSAAEATLLAAAGNAFRVNFVDHANSPATEFLPPIDPDREEPSSLYTGFLTQNMQSPSLS